MISGEILSDLENDILNIYCTLITFLRELLRKVFSAQAVNPISEDMMEITFFHTYLLLRFY